MTLIYAHRGANKEAAENTRSAFDRALNYAIDGMETDIQLSRDEVAVLWHDRYLGKLGHPTMHIDEYDLKELRLMNFAAHSGRDMPAERVMTLQEYLEAYRQRCRLLIEIKNRDWEQVHRHELKMRQTLDAIGSVQDDHIMVSSFDLNSLVYGQSYRPGFPYVLNLEPEHDMAYASSMLERHSFLHGLCVHIDTLNETIVGLVHGLGKCIAVYTCNSEREIRQALDLKVDILISDLPEKALAIRGG